VIRVPLDLARGEKQQSFIDALNAALRQSNASFLMISASGHSAEDGGYESSLTVAWPNSTSSGRISWHLLKDSKGTLIHLIVEAEGCEGTAWEQEVRELINGALVATLAERKSKYFMRTEFYYVGPRLDGEYWLPGYRFAPGDPDIQIHDVFTERVVVIDQNVMGIDGHHAAIVGREAARRHGARLSLLLNIGLYQPSGPARIWVLNKDHEIGSELRFRGFDPQEHQRTTMPRKREISPLGKKGRPILYPYGYSGYTVTLPCESRAILREIERASEGIRDAFDRCARLYQVSLVAGQQFPSVGLAYRVAAVEALAKSGGPWNGFSAFVRAHVQIDSETESLLGSLYGDVRSAHFHAGQFPMGEFGIQRWFDPLMDEAHVRTQEVGFAGSYLMRTAILSWISRVTGVQLETPELP
jgi:hypothetical protein